jgi:hypothetical protein
MAITQMKNVSGLDKVIVLEVETNKKLCSMVRDKVQKISYWIEYGDWMDGRKQEWILGCWFEQLLVSDIISWDGQDGGEIGFGKDIKSSSLAC